MAIVQQIERAAEVVATARIDAAMITLGGGPRRFPAEIAAKLGPFVQAP
jgi:hypothetical protein